LIAEQLSGRRVAGPRLVDYRLTGERWLAKCPAHADRAPSLSISEGRGGRVLLHCHAGCSLPAILQAARLSMKQLFPRGPAPQPAALAAAARERTTRLAEEAARRRVERQRIEQLRLQWQEWQRAADDLARTLATLPDDAPGAEALTQCYHDVLTELRAVDRALRGDMQ
jgi:hypothetical protein